ncbi:Cyclic nucleotide-binding domain protein [Stanieria sp. NIES-3757]|nr:Cyclic nucleotide-binding domain protein [Stanieria sp. NIES-3757]
MGKRRLHLTNHNTMEIQSCSQFFPLFDRASPHTLAWLNKIATTETYQPNETILTVDNWGQAVYLIASGWVKLQQIVLDKKTVRLIMGQGDFFGASAILDPSSLKTEVIALTKVELFKISTQRFIQILFQDNQLQHRLLQLLAKRLRILDIQCQLHYQPAAVRLINILVVLAENYGQSTEKGTKIFYPAEVDLADLTHIDVDEINKIIDNLQNNGWIEIDLANRTLFLINLKQLTNLAGKF